MTTSQITTKNIQQQDGRLENTTESQILLLVLLWVGFRGYYKFCTKDRSDTVHVVRFVSIRNFIPDKNNLKFQRQFVRTRQDS